MTQFSICPVFGLGCLGLASGAQTLSQAVLLNAIYFTLSGFGMQVQPLVSTQPFSASLAHS